MDRVSRAQTAIASLVTRAQDNRRMRGLRGGPTGTHRERAAIRVGTPAVFVIPWVERYVHKGVVS